MSLKPEGIGPVPEETARVARAAYPKGNVYLKMRDELGTIYDDTAFAHLFPNNGQPAEAPWRLALVTVLQFAEGLSDRQAAEAESQSVGLEIRACDTKLHDVSGKCQHLLRSVSQTCPHPRVRRW